MNCRAEILSIGTELLLGNIVNTDAQIISQGLSEIGINLFYHTVVGDNPERIKEAVEIAKNRADIIITTGGLGPTFDDLTKQTVAGAFGKKLELHEDIADRIRTYFEERMHMEMPQNNLQQAMLPEECVVFENDWGTAPGCAFESEGKCVIMLPGPPKECSKMFSESAIPYLKRMSEDVILSRNIHIFGEGESSVEGKLRDYMESLTNPTLAPYAKNGEVMLRVTAKAHSEEEAREMMQPVIEKVCDTIGSNVYSVDVDTLEAVVVEKLRKKGLTLALAESCSGGMLSKRITDIPGCSDIFLGSVVAYHNNVKTEILKVPEEDIKKYGAVSRSVAEAMANGVRAVLGADIGIGITGIAGPGGDGSEKPVGNVFVALSSEKGVTCKELFLSHSRGRNRMMSSSHALDMLRRYLSEY